FWALTSEWLPNSTAAAGIAWINAVGHLFGFASTYLVGVIKDASGSFALALLPLVALTTTGAIAVVLSGRRHARADRADPHGGGRLHGRLGGERRHRRQRRRGARVGRRGEQRLRRRRRRREAGQREAVWLIGQAVDALALLPREIERRADRGQRHQHQRDEQP